MLMCKDACGDFRPSIFGAKYPVFTYEKRPFYCEPREAFSMYYVYIQDNISNVLSICDARAVVKAEAIVCGGRGFDPLCVNFASFLQFVCVCVTVFFFSVFLIY